MTEQYSYGQDYLYLNYLLENTGRFSFDLRTALRNYVRIYIPLELGTGSNILDIGSCIGSLGHFLKYGGVNTYGIDLNIHAIRAGREIFGMEKANNSVVGNTVSLPFPNSSFDSIVSQDVLEHLTTSQLNCAFGEMARVLKPNKKRMFHKITVLEDKGHIDDDESHLTKWSTLQWCSFFRDCGWNVVGNPTRHFPIASDISYGNFLIERSRIS